MGDFHAQVNFYLHGNVVHAFYKLQCRQIYKGYCELDLYFASKVICACKPYIPRYMLDFEPPSAPLIPWQLCTEDYRVPRPTLSRDTLSCNVDETHLTYGRRAYTKEGKGETVKKESTMWSN